MSIRIPKSPRSITEEVFNSLTHGIGATMGLLGLVYGLLYMHANSTFMIGFYVYITSLILLMLCSCLYHALSFTRANYVFEILDHSSIYLLVAGTFTPFAVTLYSGWPSVILCLSVWTAAILGTVIKAAIPHIARRAGVLPYLLFGWFGLLFLPKLHTLNASVLGLLILGGSLYSLGVFMLVSKRRFMHVGWHLFVVAAAIAHFFAVILLAKN